jgi:ParB/RepB/Spo0J family partition protein
MKIESIKLNLLKPWPQNPRAARTDVADLVASIQAHGLIEPLVVAPNGDSTYDVIAGNRRLLALQQLDDPETPVSCHVLPESLDDDKLLEIALAENAIRLDMHPMDEAEAFAKLAIEGRDLPGIAAAFSVSERFVKQRLMLTALPAKAREAFRKGDIKYADAVALARLHDPKLVAKALKLSKEWNGNVAGAARSLENDEKRFYVKHVRFDEPEMFRITEDFFDTDGDGKPAGPYFVDYNNAMQCQMLWLTGHRGDLERSGAWEFVSMAPEAGYFTAYRRAEDKEERHVGLVLSILPSGQVQETRSISLKGEKQKAKEKAKKETAAKAEAGEKVQGGEISRAFELDLAELHRAALVAHMAKDPKLLAEHIGDLVRFQYFGTKAHDDVTAAVRPVLEAVTKTGTLAAMVALQIANAPGDKLRKQLAKTLDLEVIEWPRVMLMRLPRPMLEAEAKALKLKMEGEITKQQLVERIWKHRPKGWVPLYARL